MITSAAPTISWYRTRENILAANSDTWSYLALPTPDGAYRIAIAPELSAPPDQWPVNDFYRTNLFAPDESAARDRIELLDRLHQTRELAQYHEIGPGIMTPWGESRTSILYGDGFVHHTTGGSFGFHLDPDVNALIPSGYRHDDGWYDQHIGWASVASTFPTLYPNRLIAADQALRHLAPNTHEQINGPTSLPGETDILWTRTRGNILAAGANPWSFLALPTQDGDYRIAIAWANGSLPLGWASENFFSTSLFAPDEPAARDRIALLVNQYHGSADNLDPGTPTPWGKARDSVSFADGIVRHHTPDHGGFHLDADRNALVHPAYRNGDGWYEKEVEWNKVAVTFPTLFPFEFDRADELLAEYNPAAHAQVNGATPALSQLEARDLGAEREAMRRLNLPEYARDKHGYTLDWGDQTQTRARLTRDDQQLGARKDADGAWSYQNANSPHDRGDILDFEIHRGARTRADARAAVRPELARVEREQGLLDLSPDPAQTPDARRRDGPEEDGPDPDRRPRPGRGR